MSSDSIRGPIELAGQDSNKSGESAFHRGDFMQPVKPQMQTIKDLEGINSFKLPASWYTTEKSGLLSDSATFRPSAVDNTQISVYGGAKPLDAESSTAFMKIIDSPLPTPRIIYSEQMQNSNFANVQAIKELRNVLGRTSVGDNQFTSPSSRTPAFHMNSATVETINGKKVLAVNGWFTQMDDKAEIKMDEHGPLKRLYSGVFFETPSKDPANIKVKEFYLLADDKLSFNSHKAAFRNALQSIEWK